MWLQFDLVLLCSCNLSYLQSVLTHFFLCRSRKLGHELSISNKLPVWPATPPECTSLDPHFIFNFFISTMPPLLREWLFYWAYFWTPKAMSGKAEMTVPFDANLIIWLHLLVYCTYSSVGNASEGLFDLPWLALTICFFLYGLYIPYVHPSSATPRTDLKQSMAVF